MEEKKVSSWKNGVRFALASLLILAGVFYFSYFHNLMTYIGFENMPLLSYISPVTQIICYYVFGILAFIMIGRHKCPGVFFKLSLLLLPLGNIYTRIRILTSLQLSSFYVGDSIVKIIFNGLLIIAVLFALFNLAGKKRLWTIIAVSMFTVFNLIDFVSYLDIGLSFSFIASYLFSLILVAYGVLYLLLTLKGSDCGCAKCECEKKEDK